MSVAYDIICNMIHEAHLLCAWQSHVSLTSQQMSVLLPGSAGHRANRPAGESGGAGHTASAADEVHGRDTAVRGGGRGQNGRPHPREGWPDRAAGQAACRVVHWVLHSIEDEQPAWLGAQQQSQLG